MSHLVEPGRLRAALVTSTDAGRGGLWVEVDHHASTDSTNARALELARPGLVVVADHQSAGRGRMARAWESPPGASLLLTATLALPAEGAGWLPLLTGLAVQRALREVCGLDATLKWPNDVLLSADDDRKVCGVLCEVGGSGGSGGSGGDPRGQVVAVGIGLNVAQGRDDLPVPTATSLALAGVLADDVDRTDLAAAVLAHLGRAYDALTTGGGAAAGERAAYRRACSTLGREVRLHRISAPDVVGTAVEVDDQGRLLIDVDGVRTAWAAGDVVHVRPAR
ncbi:MAG: biotin--[acetyl-CoA-carboxylase] ligase [Actinomycetota bacterium]|nr:biotin--[acetyl-CoA-carboxylase] ligase [Actinomycetota bacterium]